MKDTIKFSASGVITIKRISNNKIVKTTTRSNEILLEAYKLLPAILAGDESSKLTKIRVYNGATLLSSGDITETEYQSPNTVQFSATFDEDSFNGDFDKCKLGPSDPEVIGNFAQAQVDETKTNDESIVITWAITMNPIEG